MNTQHRHQWVGGPATFSFWIIGLNQGNQTFPGHHLIHLDQEQFLTGLLALAGILGVGEGHLFHHRKARRLVSGDFAKLGSLFQNFLSSLQGTIETAHPLHLNHYSAI
ncbi:hypothetical protein KPSA3_07484 [Pseudomonas syringae pv. actinidiae]|uniref:Uncharacterized protein n=1 Tax=Pseudomonas syringae pv. actinidiae TaxID=103796 RepID=A0AAN4TQL3_PSESF|nr:hypothetical protein KPSA3_07484 [Pseudomonas syringae pv. actinidiae]